MAELASGVIYDALFDSILRSSEMSGLWSGIPGSPGPSWS